MKGGISSARLVAAALAALLFGAGSSGATSVVAKSFADLCREADHIFLGRVVEVKSEWADAAHSRIETAVTFSDLRWLHGVEGRELTLRFAGGEVDGISEAIGGMPRFRVGQRVLLFTRDEASISPIVGFHQGCVEIVRNPGGEEVVIGAEGRPVVAVGAAGFELGEAGADLSKAVSLTTVLSSIEECLRAGESDE